MRIPFDNKSHKRVRRLAARVKESVRMSFLRADDDSSQQRASRRRTRRATSAACIALALVFAGFTQAQARGAAHAGTHKATSHHGLQIGAASSPIGAFRARFGR